MTAETRNQLQLGRLVIESGKKQAVPDLSKQMSKNMICVTSNAKILIKSDFFYN